MHCVHNDSCPCSLNRQHPGRNVWEKEVAAVLEDIFSPNRGSDNDFQGEAGFIPNTPGSISPSAKCISTLRHGGSCAGKYRAGGVDSVSFKTASNHPARGPRQSAIHSSKRGIHFDSTIRKGGHTGPFLRRWLLLRSVSIVGRRKLVEGGVFPFSFKEVDPKRQKKKKKRQGR
jgi:hypothetical protein